MLWPPSINKRPKGISQFLEISTESPIIGIIFSEKGDFSIFFKNSGNLYNSLEMKSIADHDRVKFVGVVTDCISRTSRNGNKYMRAEVQDDFGKVNFIWVI